MLQRGEYERAQRHDVGFEGISGDGHEAFLEGNADSFGVVLTLEDAVVAFVVGSFMGAYGVDEQQRSEERWKEGLRRCPYERDRVLGLEERQNLCANPPPGSTGYWRKSLRFFFLNRRKKSEGLGFKSDDDWVLGLEERKRWWYMPWGEVWVFG